MTYVDSISSITVTPVLTLTRKKGAVADTLAETATTKERVAPAHATGLTAAPEAASPAATGTRVSGVTEPGDDPRVQQLATEPMPVLPSATIPVSFAPNTLDFWGRRIGASDLRVFPIGLGAHLIAEFGDAVASRELLDAFADHGGNLVDTSAAYGDGASDTIIGDWMRDRGNRDQVILATTAGSNWGLAGVDVASVTSTLETSLRRLATDHVDLLLLGDDGVTPFDETLLAVDELIRAGKVRYFGFFEPTANRLIEARVLAAQLGVAPAVAVQSRFNIIERGGLSPDLAAVVRQQGLALLPRFGLAGGFLSGRYRARADLATATEGRDMAPLLTKRNQRILEALDVVAAELETSVATVATSWLLANPSVVAPIFGVRRAEHILELVAAVRTPLSRHQFQELQKASS